MPDHLKNYLVREFNKLRAPYPNSHIVKFRNREGIERTFDVMRHFDMSEVKIIGKNQKYKPVFKCTTN